MPDASPRCAHDVGVDPTPKLWSEDAWRALATRVASLARGGGATTLNLTTSWMGYTRWGRGAIRGTGDIRENSLLVQRDIHGANQAISITTLDDTALRDALDYLEQLIAAYRRETLESYDEPPFSPALYAHPTLWFPSTFAIGGAERNVFARGAIDAASAAGMVSTGYLETSARGTAVARPKQGILLYYPSTEAQFSLTVRDPEGTGSGWAGVNWNDWTRLDVAALSAVALDKCLRSRNPVAIEPGRYTAILEPQAVYDLCEPAVNAVATWSDALSSSGEPHPYHDERSPVKTKIGQRIMDRRLFVTTDPMDPDLGFVPFDGNGEPYHPATWVEGGVLKHLAYDRRFAIDHRVGNTGLLASGAFRMQTHDATTPINEMIATTLRGILVTRFSGVTLLDKTSLLYGGYTRDGLWLIEHGKISKAIKNFRFTESPLLVLNQVEQIGATTRVFAPGTAAMVPALKVQDFSFTGLSDAV